MASLIENLYNSNPMLKTSSGQLGSTSLEEASKLAGRSASPITPAGAASMGVGPSSAKMAGVPSQKINAIRDSVKGEDLLGTYLRREQARTAATQAETAEMKRIKDLAMMGRLDQVADKVATKALTGDTSFIATLNTLPDTDLKNFLPAGANVSIAKPVIGKLAAGQVPTDSELLAFFKDTNIVTGEQQISSLLSDPKNALTVINNALTSGGADAIAKGIAGTIDAKADLSMQALSQEDLKELGFSSLDQMAAALRVDPAAFKELSISAVNDIFQSQFGDIDKLRQMAVDPNLSANERQQAITQLKALGAVGMRYAVESMDPIQKQVDAATTVNIPGLGDIPVAKLTDNEHVAGLIKKAIIENNLDQLPPGLREWVNKNRAEVDKLIAKTSERAVALGTQVQANYTTLKNLPTDTNDAMKKILFGPTYDPLSATPLAKPSILTTYESAPVNSPTRQALEVFMKSDIASLAPEVARQVINYTPAQLAASNLLSPEGMQRLVDYYAIFSVAKDSSPEILMQNYLGTQDVGALYKELSTQDSYGILNPDGQELLNLLDSNNDGKPDSPSEIKTNLLNGWMKVSDGKPVGPDNIKNVKLPDSIKDTLAANRSVATNNSDYKLYETWMADGKIDGGDINRTIREKNLSISDAASMVSRVQMPDGIRTSAMKSLENQAYNQLAADTKESTATTSLEQYDELIARLKTLAPTTEPEKAAVDRRIKELEKIRTSKEKADRELAERIASAEQRKIEARNRAASSGAPRRPR